mmetsp:Transcript_42908/g.64658  ORF Transcript_42908/g.64658 Transcript_42908/m.64658 type:complete len:80 (-) Transcript_42908:462-701(-)
MMFKLWFILDISMNLIIAMFGRKYFPRDFTNAYSPISTLLLQWSFLPFLSCDDLTGAHQEKCTMILFCLSKRMFSNKTF